MIGEKLLLKTRWVILFLSTRITIEALTLAITPELQPGAEVCWTSCADMLLQYYGNPPNLHGIWQSGTGGYDSRNGLCAYYPGAPKNVRDILAYGNTVRNVSSTCHSGAELYADLKKDIQACKPIIAGLADDKIWGHVVLIIGYLDNGTTIYFNDPATGKQGNAPYDVFCSNSSFYWEESLIPVNGSPSCNTPVATPSISITSGPTQFSYPGSKKTYTSVFNCPSGQTCMPPTKWNWSLSFFHKTGTYVASSIQNLNGMGASTWNVSAFSLPASGYQWNYTDAGLVTGVVNVASGGYSSWKTVTYAPQTLIPGHVDFVNQTVSGSHSAIASHYCIDINNVTINAGASIAFNAGSCCTVTNLTVINGANVTLKIDPLLQ